MSKSTPLVSVIVPTRNNDDTIEVCLKSIKAQSHKNIELIVVDNNSSDDTPKIAKRLADKAFNQGPERSAQRNYGASKSKGEYVFFIDSDMDLSKDVVKECVRKTENAEVTGVVVPEISIGEGFWTKVKILEREFYQGVPWMEAARFFRKSDFDKLGGYDEELTGAEDYDMSQRLENIGSIERTGAIITHDEGRLTLTFLVKKKYYYARKSLNFLAKRSEQPNSGKQMSIFGRYALFLSKPGKLFRNPLLGVSLLFLKTVEFAASAIGLIFARLRS